MREFDDESGAVWEASARSRGGEDYKGRYHMVLSPRDGAGEGVEIALLDVEWNSEATASRTLSTMSEGELRRRLRIAKGRHG